MRARVLVVVAVCAGCAGSAGCASTARPPPPVPAPPPAPVTIDAALAVDAVAIDAPPPPPQVGAACRRDDATTCATGARCLAWTAGYCSAACDLDRACGDPAATCVATPRLGATCARRCTSDADCRVDDGYLCDRSWHACLLPNTAALVPRRCPPPSTTGGADRDRGFGSAEALPLADDARIERDPALAITARGVVAIATGTPAPGDGSGGGSGSGAGAVGDEPALAATGATGALAAWIRDDGERRALVIAALGAPAAPARDGVERDDCAGDPSCPARPRLVAAGRVVYLAYSGDAIGTRVRVAPAGGDFGAATTALVGRRGDLAVGGDGRVHVVAMRGGDGGAYGAAQHVIEYAWSRDGARTFARAVRVSARDELIPAFFASPVLAVDDRRGWLYVGYVRGGTDAVWDVVIAASKDRGATWARTVIGDGCALRAVPSLAVDPTTGTLHVAFYDTRAEVARFAHVACAPGAQRCADKGAIDDTPFASFDTGRLDARWVGDQTALVVDDKRRLLHAAWTEPVDVDGHVVARVFHATAKL